MSVWDNYECDGQMRKGQQMDNYIAIILIPVYILLVILGRRLLTFAHGYEKGLEDAEKIRKMKEKADDTE